MLCWLVFKIRGCPSERVEGAHDAILVRATSAASNGETESPTRERPNNAVSPNKADVFAEERTPWFDRQDFERQLTRKGVFDEEAIAALR